MNQIQLIDFNKLNKDEALKALKMCCGSTKWYTEMEAKRPFQSEEELFKTARNIWYTSCTAADYKEAFSHHPKIGDRENLRERYGESANWANDEQANVAQAKDEIISLLASNNAKYEDEFGFVFLVCATGKSAEEMSDLLIQRLLHSPSEELSIAAGEQFKITLLRLQKLIDLNSSIWNQASHITTHVLDTSIGSPGHNIPIRLKHKINNDFSIMALGMTNKDGRIANLLPSGLRLAPGHYKMCFDTTYYFNNKNITGFYPKVDIDFTVFDDTHYHVPLLINPYGYSTYRGS